MCRSAIIIIILNFIIIVLLAGIVSDRKEYLEGFEGEDFDDLLFTAYSKKFTCSSCQDKLPLHVRINDAGGIMYTTYHKPTEATCKPVSCAKYLDTDNNIKLIGWNKKEINLNDPKILPYRVTLACPERLDNTFCWKC